MDALELAYAHRLLAPRVAYLVGSYSEEGEPNLIPVSNVTSLSTEPQCLIVAIFEEWQTCKNLATSEGFTLCVPRSTQAEAVWKLGARYSGFRVDSRRDKLQRC